MLGAFYGVPANIKCFLAFRARPGDEHANAEPIFEESDSDHEPEEDSEATMSMLPSPPQVAGIGVGPKVLLETDPCRWTTLWMPFSGTRPT